MSRDIKYIGMDLHKEATVIAVLNGSGKLVMESIVETEANMDPSPFESSIALRQCVRGPRKPI
jgi:hypothetical protein